MQNGNRRNLTYDATDRSFHNSLCWSPREDLNLCSLVYKTTALTA